MNLNKRFFLKGGSVILNDKAFLTFYEKTMTAYMERIHLRYLPVWEEAS